MACGAGRSAADPHPFAILGAWLGVRAHFMLSKRLFFGVAYVLLTLTGTKLIWDALT